jgi:hypothetical protein
VKAFGVLFCSSILLAGCGVARTSYHVATAPVTIVHRQFQGRSQTTTTTTTSASSDVDVPGRSVAGPSSTPPRQVVTQTPPTNRNQPAQARFSASSRATNPSEFPVAKAVPGKPGYVYSPYDSSKYVDVSGYTPGSKVKDPYAQKIFIVP